MRSDTLNSTEYDSGRAYAMIDGMLDMLAVGVACIHPYQWRVDIRKQSCHGDAFTLRHFVIWA